MIVKNEEQVIQQCLESVKDVVDEMIIVDTGSTDSTVDICKSFGANVFEFAWTGGFATARNYSLQQATGDWILWLDADEKLDQADGIHIRNILEAEKAHIGLVKLMNYIGGGDENNETYIIYHHRLLRNKMGFQFDGIIHEKLNVNEVVDGKVNAQVIEATIHHYGYLEDIVQKQNKTERNLYLLEQAKQEPDYDPWVDYHIASEFNRLQRYQEAFTAVNTSLYRFIERKQKPPSLLYTLKYSLMLSTGSYQEAYPGIEKAIEIYPNYVDLHFYKGVIFFLKKRYQDAIAIFQHCLTLGEENMQYLILQGVGSFYAWYYIGKCHEGMDNKTEAITAYEQSVQCCSNYKLAKKALSHLKVKQLTNEFLEKKNMKKANDANKKGITISLCMIVRDEEKSLARCLKSVQGFVDEMIIVDTGSIDNTKQIARRFQAKIFDFTWIDDFAAARNFAFGKASKEYILWLDADDIIEKKDQQQFKQLKQTLSSTIDSVTMPYVFSVDENGNTLYSLRRNRLVKRAAGFQWHGVVHEYMLVGGNITHSDIRILHQKDKQHTDRNLRIYESKLARDEEFSPRDLYYYANELKDHSQYEDAIVYYEKFLNTEQGWVEDNIQACKKLSVCFGNIDKPKEQFMSLVRSFYYDKPRAVFCCDIGSIWLHQKEYTKAIYWFEQATQLPEVADQLSMVEPACWTWIPHLQLCICYDNLGEIEKACYHNEIALLFHPTHKSMVYNQKYFKDRLGEERFKDVKQRVQK